MIVFPKNINLGDKNEYFSRLQKRDPLSFAYD